MWFNLCGVQSGDIDQELCIADNAMGGKTAFLAQSQIIWREAIALSFFMTGIAVTAADSGENQNLLPAADAIGKCSGGFDNAGNFMPERHRQFGTSFSSGQLSKFAEIHVPIADVQVRMAKPGRCDAHKDLFSFRFWHCLGAALHCSSPIQCVLVSRTPDPPT